ncbi:MAG: hypothetical protein AAGF26_18330 [Cyanobacteria bacterium P01_G01_bin.49]
MYQGGIRGKTDSRTTANREMSSGKQVLEKCLNSEPQSERAAHSLAPYGDAGSLLNVDSTTIQSRSIFDEIAASLRR